MYFERTISLFQKLRGFNLSDVPYDVLHNLAEVAQQALNEFKNIREFSLQKHPSNPQQQRDSFINQVRDRYDHYYQALTPQIAFFIRKESDIDEIEQKARDTVKALDELHTVATKRENEALGEARSILDSIRKVAQETGVSQQGVFFDEEAKKHETLALFWLKMTITVGVLILVAATAFIIWPQRLPSDFTTPQSIQLAIVKIILFSVLFFGLTLASRVYRAHRHNAVLNKHRYNALMTFQAFVKGTDDDPTKNAVLLRSTETIFSPSNSGFITGESENSSYPQVLEIIKSAVSSK
jgi:hypothetical protein